MKGLCPRSSSYSRPGQVRGRELLTKVATRFAIIAVYVDDLNLIGTSEEFIKTIDYLKKEFEIKDLGKTKYCLGLQIGHCSDGVLIHQSTYTEKVMKRFHRDKSYPP